MWSAENTVIEAPKLRLLRNPLEAPGRASEGSERNRRSVACAEERLVGIRDIGKMKEGMNGLMYGRDHQVAAQVAWFRKGLYLGTASPRRKRLRVSAVGNVIEAKSTGGLGKVKERGRRVGYDNTCDGLLLLGR